MNEIGYSVRSALPSDRSRLANLIHFGAYTHQHLDWKPPLDWIGSSPFLLAENKGMLSAALACPPEIPAITWIRLFATSASAEINSLWSVLWDSALEELHQTQINSVAALSLQGWFNEILENSKFLHTDNVIVLMWESSRPMLQPKASGARVRVMVEEDLDVVEKIDHKAFGLVWKNSRESLEIAFRQATIASVVEVENEIVGYQYSTTSGMGGHLARLAVNTQWQGKGIGYLLVHELLRGFTQRGIEHVTVNTQQNNAVSLALYSKAGFNQTGESYRVYQYPL